MFEALKEWFGFGAQNEFAHAEGHAHAGPGGHGHTHGVIDPSLSSNERGIWAIKWSFVILAITSVLQLIIVFYSGEPQNGPGAYRPAATWPPVFPGRAYTHLLCIRRKRS